MHSFWTFFLACIILGIYGKEVEDDFRSYNDGSRAINSWKSSSFDYCIEGGKFVQPATTSGYSLWRNASSAYDIYYEADVVIEKSNTSDGSWGFAGLGLFVDYSNYFALLLGENPTTKEHYVELNVAFKGGWNKLGTLGKYLSASGNDYSWEFNTLYKLVFSIQEGSCGYGNDVRAVLAGKVYKGSSSPPVTELIFGITNKTAFVNGRPGIRSCRVKTVFSRTYANWTHEAKEDNAGKFPAYVPREVCSSTVEGYERLPKGKKTGYFHVEHFKEEDKWWVVDPEGNLVYLRGVDHVTYYGMPCEKKGTQPYHDYVVAKYNDNQTAWALDQQERLKKMSFNFVAISHSESMRHLGIPHSITHTSGEFSKKFDRIAFTDGYAGLPNVFHPLWEDFITFLVESDSEKYVGDPWVVGHFFDNELQWWGTPPFTCTSDWCLFREASMLPKSSSAKAVWADIIYKNLTATYSSFSEGMSTVFGVTGVATVDDLLARTTKIQPTTDVGLGIATTFLRTVAERYFSTVSAAIHKVDPNHMYLCDRLPGNMPAFGDILDKYCDIITINFYPTNLNPYTGIDTSFITRMDQWHESTPNRPILITEWSFPALDSGLPCTTGAGMRVDTQEQRGRCMQLFLLQLASLPYVVGSDYFMYIDDPPEGVFLSNPEDSNYGLVTSTDEVWTTAASFAEKANKQTCARHITGINNDLREPKTVKWLEEEPLGSESTSFSGSRGLQLSTSPEGLLLVKQNSVTLGNIYVTSAWKYKNQTQWLQAQSFALDKVYVGDKAARMDFVVTAPWSKYKVRASMPKSTGSNGETQPWIAMKVMSIELSDSLEESAELQLIDFIFNSSIGTDGKTNDAVGNLPLPIKNFYQKSYFTYDSNAKAGMSVYPFGAAFAAWNSASALTVESTQYLTHFNANVVPLDVVAPVVEPGETWKSSSTKGIGTVFYAPIVSCCNPDPILSHNRTLSALQNEAFQFLEPRVFSYESRNDYSDNNVNSASRYYTGNTLFAISLLLPACVILPLRRRLQMGAR